MRREPSGKPDAWKLARPVWGWGRGETPRPTPRRVTGTPEELIIDFGLNPQPFGVLTEPIAMSQRIIANFHTAKRMLHALMLTLQRHEATFGVLETDMQRRVHPTATPQPR